MDKDLAGQDAKDLYDVSVCMHLAPRILFGFSLIGAVVTGISLFPANGSYFGMKYVF